MSNPMGDRNLLAGILAWQKKFIGSDVLVAAMNAWTLAKEKGLAQILREQKALTENQHALLEEAIHDHLARHGNDVQKTLATLRAVDPVKQELAHIADSDLQASLAHVSSASAPVAEEAILVAEVAEIAAAPKKTPTPQKPVKAAAKKNAAAKPQAKTPRRGSPALVWLAGCALGGGFAVLLGTLVLGLAFFLLRDHPRFAQAKPDVPVNQGNPIDKGGKPPPPIEVPKDPEPLNVEPKPIEPKPIEPKPAPPAPADGFVSLFNGKDLTGWKLHKTRGGDWRVENGILVGSPTNNGVYFLQTEQPQPRDFHLRMEARMGAPGNGSVYFRYQPDGPIVGYEAMIRAANNLPGQVAVGGLALTNPGKGRAFPGGTRVQVPVGQWFTLEVIAKGDRLIAKADGQTTVDMIDASILTAGHVALGQITQSPIEFRKIEIKELKGAADAPLVAADGFAPLFNGKDLTGWKKHPRQGGNWRVENGLLVGWGEGNGNLVGLLFTDRVQPKNFHLRVEARVGDKGRGAVMVRCPESSMFGYEASLATVTGAIHVGDLRYQTPGKSGFLPGSPIRVIPPDQWITLEIIANEERLIVKVNGAVTTDLQDAKALNAGHVRLCHVPTSKIEFRKIEIKELNAEAPPERVVVVPVPKDVPPIVPPPKDAPPFVLDKDFVPLFNGKDLTGWKQGDKRQRDWKVLDGILTGAGPDLNSLYTPRDDYGDFHLRAEVRINDIGDSHILFRSPYGPAEIDSIKSGGYLVRLNANPNVITKAGSLMVIEKVGVRNLFVKEPMVRPGQWFNLEVIAQGNRVITKLNGQEAINYLNPKTDLMGGRLVLTAANLFNGNTLVEFRKIEIKEFKAVPPPPRDPIVVAKFVPLFNGKDLTGWKSAGQPPRGWKVVDGILTGSGPNLDALYTPRDNYGDFHLRMEARINDDGNSFVAFRCPLGAAELDAMMLGGYAVRLNGRPDDQSKTGSLLVFDRGATRHHFFAKGPSPPAGEWFSVEIITKGDRVETKINGRNMLLNNPKKDLKSGRIVLGLTDVKNRQTLVEFRKIEISEANEVIAAPPEKRGEIFVPLFNGKDLTGWKVHQKNPGEWRVENGVLIGKAPPKWKTILHTERADFKDFHLRVEARGSLKSSGGVGVRSADGGQLGYVANISGVFPPTVIRVGGVAAYTDDNKAFTLPRLADVNLPPGQWFTLEVIADGKRLTVLVDGKKVTDVNNATMLAGGHVTLGISGPDTLEVRKVELAEFKPAAEPPPVGAVGEFAPLFNGKDLAGWQAHAKRPGNWRVENGILIGSAPVGGSLYSARADYQDFHLRAEVRINDQGFGRIFGRAAYDPTKIPFKVLGYEVLINQRPLGDKTGTLTATSLLKTTAIQAKETLAKPGDWLLLEVVAKGDLVTVKVNGLAVAEFQDDKRQFARSGHIALHQDANATIEFRKVEIADLTAPKAGPPIGVKVPVRMPDPPILDFWEAVFLEGIRIGYVHTLAEKLAPDGDAAIRTTATLRLKIKRGDQFLEIGMETGTTETATGQVSGTFMRQYLGDKQALEMTGTVMGKELQRLRDKKTLLPPAPWNNDAVGLYRQQSLWKDRQLKPGDRFSYRSFDHNINVLVTNEVVVHDQEEIEAFAGAAKVRLLRVEVRPEKIPTVPYAPLLLWINKEGVPVRTEMDMVGMGKLILYRTTAAIAQAPGDAATVPDVFAKHIYLDRRIAANTTAAAYRIVTKGLDEADQVFSQDDRQEIKNRKGNLFELHVRTREVPAPPKVQANVGAEYLQSNFFITSDDRQVKKLARDAVGGEEDPWKRAVFIEKWVFDHMTPTRDQALVPADQVAQTLKGDSTEYAMLMAAMCRAEGIPARTAMGYVYGEVKDRPAFVLCMWTEVWIHGVWMPLDATQGRGRIGATHLKVTDHSWHNERALTPLLPIARLLDRVAIEIIRTE